MDVMPPGLSTCGMSMPTAGDGNAIGNLSTRYCGQVRYRPLKGWGAIQHEPSFFQRAFAA